MIRIYYLKPERINNTDTVKGIEFVHDAILGQEGKLHKLIQNTTDTEHTGLIVVAVSWREATTQEIALLGKMIPPPSPPQRNLVAEVDAIKARLSSLGV